MPRTSSIVPITFAVSHNDEPVNVTLTFADNTDVMSATRWRVPRELADDAAMQARAADAREYALLAAKRWKHYRDTKTAAFSLPQLQAMIAHEPEGEFCFYLKVTADWFPASLGGPNVIDLMKNKDMALVINTPLRQELPRGRSEDPHRHHAEPHSHHDHAPWC